MSGRGGSQVGYIWVWPCVFVRVSFSGWFTAEPKGTPQFLETRFLERSRVEFATSPAGCDLLSEFL